MCLFATFVEKAKSIIMSIHFTPEQKKSSFAHIIEQIKLGRPVRRILRDDDGMPNVSSFYRWIDEDEKMQKQYARAMEIRADFLFEQTIEIADDDSDDLEITDNGTVRLNKEFAARSKIRIEARQFAIARMAPKRYGNKIDITSDNKAIASPIIGMVIKNEPDPPPFEDELL